MIKNLLFDMGGVIFTQNTPEAFRRFRRAGIDPDFYLGVYGQKDFFLDLEMGRISQEEFCRRMAAAAGRERVSLEEARECWLGFIDGVEPERLRWLEDLRNGYHLGLLSNTNPFVMEYMDGCGMNAAHRPISSYFDSMFLSYEMGVCKPSAEIFRMALERDGMRGEETLFVDDSAANVAAACELGIRGLHVATNEPWLERLGAELAGFGR